MSRILGTALVLFVPASLVAVLSSCIIVKEGSPCGHDDGWCEDDDWCEHDDDWCEHDDCEDDHEDDPEWDPEDCVREFSFDLGTFGGGTSGWIEGDWDAGYHGAGWMGAMWTWEADRAVVEGGWGPEDGAWEGELVGWIYTGDEDGGDIIQGFAWTDELEGFFWAPVAEWGEGGWGEGWWTFAEAEVEAHAIGESDGEWSGSWTIDDEIGDVHGSWGTDESGEAGWLEAEFTMDESELGFTGTWYPWVDDLIGWEGMVDEWGYVYGDAVQTEAGLEMVGLGYPYGCP